MINNKSPYLNHKDGAYEAASSKDIFQYSTIQLLVKVLIQIFLNIPGFLKDFVRTYIWTERKSVRGQLALVTGGGNGLGKALCFQLAREGCRIAVADIDLASADKTAEEVRSLGVDAEAFRVDVGDFLSVQQLRTEIERKLGSVDILVNNAGLLALAAITHGTEADIQRIISVNLTAHFWTIRQFMPGMIQRRKGHIVGVSSLLGYVPSFLTQTYCATKFGVRGLMESFSEELYMTGLENEIFTSCVYPTFISTRKELMDIVKESKICAPIFKPERVAYEVVEGMLRNRKEIIVSPCYMKPFVKAIPLMPRRLFRIFSDCALNDGLQSTK